MKTPITKNVASVASTSLVRLLPCPFCGSAAKPYCETVTCSNPRCKIHFAAVPEMHTVEEWNRRVQLPKMPTIAECEETPKTDAIIEEIKRNNWREWKNLEMMEDHAKRLERSENKLKRRIRQLLHNRGWAAAESVMDKMAEEISQPNIVLSRPDL